MIRMQALIEAKKGIDFTNDDERALNDPFNRISDVIKNLKQNTQYAHPEFAYSVADLA